MKETDDDVRHLEALLEKSITRAGAYLKLAFGLPGNAMTAVELIEHFSGLVTVALATVNAKGEPRVAPVDALLCHARFFMPTVAHSARVRHLQSNPGASVTYWESDSLAVVAHGRATVVGPRDSWFPEVDEELQRLSGRSVRRWDRGVYVQLEPTTVLAYLRRPPALASEPSASSREPGK